MSNTRRKKIERVETLLKGLLDDLESILNEEQDAYDSIPENLQMSQRGMDSEDAINSLEAAIESIEESIDNLEDII